MFLLGVAVGALLVLWPRLQQFHNFCSAINEQNTVCNTIRNAALFATLYLEQYFRKSLVYDSIQQAYVLSFIMKGSLHKIYVMHPKGPPSALDRTRDPFDLGYSSIVSRDK